MDNTRVVIDNGDGTVDILTPVSKTRTLDEIIAKGVPEGKSHRVIDVSGIPGDRVFRGAWTDDNPTDTVDIDLPRAKEIAHRFRRRQRDTLMKPLDIQTTIPSEAEAAETAREKVRVDNAEMQVNIDAAGSPEALRTICGL